MIPDGKAPTALSLDELERLAAIAVKRLRAGAAHL
jgi:hypothetical protein